jgi:FOG: FHA domain
MSVSLIERSEAAIRRFFAKLGGALDRQLGPAQVADLASLVQMVEQAVERELRRRQGRVEAPNLIELRYDYESFSRLSREQIDFLRRELLANITEYIYNRRYVTIGELSLNISFDPFVKHLKVEARFTDGEATNAPLSRDRNSNAQAKPPATYALTLRTTIARTPQVFKGNIDPYSGSATVGRSRDNAIVIDHPSVSNFHATFTRTADSSLWLADLGSSNGTFVNGVQVLSNERKFVKAGDCIRFGDVDAELDISDEKRSGN